MELLVEMHSKIFMMRYIIFYFSAMTVILIITITFTRDEKQSLRKVYSKYYSQKTHL